ncbi:MAG: ATP-dependent helicase/nuclease subunit A [Candidatus Deianiraeaceae bacterium]|jgi:ATP-dependent helicase/nuclease subunit A
MKIKNNNQEIISQIITANAGSGKTYSVVERIKHILTAGHSINSILCITFTKAGQQEMEKRLYEEGVMQEEKPKILTFHALCLEVVSMFTHELNMPFEFEIVDSNNLPNNIIQDIIKNTINTPKAQEYIKTFRLLPSEFQTQCVFIISKYHQLNDSQSRIKSLQETFSIENLQFSKDKILQLKREVLEEIPVELMQTLKGAKTQEILPFVLEIIRKYKNDGNVYNNFNQYIEVVKSIRGKEIKEYKESIKEVQEEIIEIETFQKSYLLNTMVEYIIVETERQKKIHKQYTFDDLQHKAQSILTNPELRDFALFKFASKIQHIIVDEAQDTNQTQWNIIGQFIEEFIAVGMEGRSLFIVGDIKQTIYSFQGAESGIMEGVYKKYQPYLTKSYLAKSYRSTQPVLDAINSMAESFGIDENSKHISAFSNEVGSVHIISCKHKSQTGGHRDTAMIAQKLAKTVQNLLGKPLQHEKEKYYGKPIQPQDIAILVRSRPNEVASQEIHNAFFEQKIPISFNTKIHSKNSYAILDFIAIIKLCVLQSDLLSLYGILKSPIFQLDETTFETLFDKQAKAEDIYKQYPFVFKAITQYTHIMHSLGITSLLIDLYSIHGYKYSKTERTVLEAFIESSKQFNSYNFIDFIQNFETSNGEFSSKENNQNAVALTTVHASKGLEYPVVIFLDLKTRDRANTDSIIIHDGTPIFKISGTAKGKTMQNILDINKAEDFKEELRLYYVAISRASEHFYYICNQSRTDEKHSDKSFYHLLTQGIEAFASDSQSNNDFHHLQYTKEIEVQPIEHHGIPRILVKYTPSQITTEEQTFETQYGIFIHQLFENIEQDELQESEYIIPNNTAFKESLEKVQRFNKAIEGTIQFYKKSREYELIHSGKIIRLDAIYYTQNEIIIIDYKTQKQGITQEISYQMNQYKQAVDKVYSQKVRCFIAWFNEEILEEI